LTNNSDPDNITCEVRDEWADEVLLFPEAATNCTINGTRYEVPCVDVALWSLEHKISGGGQFSDSTRPIVEMAPFLECCFFPFSG